MDCQQAQNELLSAESLNLLAPELSAHLAECPECQLLLAKLRKLDAATNALPVPAGHDQPSAEFLRTVAAAAARSGRSIQRFARRAIAAAVILAFGLAAISLLFFNNSTVQADVLIGQLVDWNLAIAHVHDTPTRTRVYQQQLQQLQAHVKQSKLDPADRALADSLLSNAQWLTTENNTSAESQRFQAIANQLLARRQAATDGAAEHLQQIYQQLINQGVNSGAGSSTSPSSPSGDAAPVAPTSSSFRLGNPGSSPVATQSLLASVAPVESLPTVIASIGHDDASPDPLIDEDNSIAFLPRSLGPTDSAWVHSGGIYTHHSASHSSGSGPVASSGDSSHDVASAASTTAAPLSARSSADTSPNFPEHPSADSQASASAQAAAPPPQNRGYGSALPPPPHFTHLASLHDITGWESFPAAPSLSSSDLSSPFALDPPAFDPPASDLTIASVAGEPVSRRDVDERLAEHIAEVWQGPSDWSSSMTPPMSALDRATFSHFDTLARPVAFPEPAMGLVPLAAALLLRRRRRS